MTTLVLLPGLDGTGKLFQPFIRELPADWRVIVASYPADARSGYAQLASLTLTMLPPEGRAVLLGESFSGPIAIQLASALGPRVQALVLCCTFARNPVPGWALSVLSWVCCHRLQRCLRYLRRVPCWAGIRLQSRVSCWRKRSQSCPLMYCAPGSGR
jgi:pimeloyl-ACP methyl ester carboxylesterase